jgi:cytochrome c
MVQLIAMSAIVARPADIELGRYLATECMTCHRAATGSAIPNIFGLPETTFADVLRAYREKRLPNEVMRSIASRLNDEDIASLALFFATTKKP